MNEKNKAGCTPLQIAAAMGFSRLLKLYLEHPECNINTQVRYLAFIIPEAVRWLYKKVIHLVKIILVFWCQT